VLDLYSFFLMTIIFIIINLWVFLMYRYTKEALKKEENFDFFDIKTLDNKAYWIYNSSIYYAQVKNGVIDRKSIEKIKDFGINPKEMYEMIGK
jgi:hypothetical protein